MGLSRIFALSLFVTSLSGCTTGSTVVNGPVTEAIETAEVSVHYQAPPCAFEPVADIELNGGYFSRAALLDGFREKAAQLGANVVQVTYLKKIGSNEYYGSARALRCH